MLQTTHYQTLKVAEDAPQAVIASAHQALSQATHRAWRTGGDNQTAVSQTRMLESAYAVLSDPARRAAYDEGLRQQRSQLVSGPPIPRVEVAPARKQSPPPIPRVIIQNPEARKETRDPVGWLVKGVCVLVIFIAAAAGKVLIQEWMGPKPSRPSYRLPVTPHEDWPTNGGQKKVVPAGDDWKRQEVAGLSLELPGKPRVEKAGSPEDALGLISKLEAYKLTFGNEEIVVNHADYVGIDPDLDGAVEGMLNFLKSAPTVTNLENKTSSVTCDKMPARRVTTTFSQSGAAASAYTLAVARGHSMWSVLVVGSSAKTAETAERIFGSIRLPVVAAPLASSKAAVTKPAAASVPETAPGYGAMEPPGPTEPGWQRHGFAGLTLDLPKGVYIEEKEAAIKDRTHMRRCISDYFYYDSVEVSVNYWEAAQEDAGIDGAVALYMETFKGGPQAVNPQTSVTNIQRDGVSGRAVKATFSRDGYHLAYAAIFLTHREHLWFVTVFGAPWKVDEIGRDILNNVRLKGLPYPPNATASSTKPAPASVPPPAGGSSSVAIPEAKTVPPKPPVVPGQTQHFSGIALWLPEGLVPVEHEKVMPAESGFRKNVACKLWWGGVGIQITHVEHAENAPSLDRAIDGIVEDYRLGLGAKDIETHEFSYDRDGAPAKVVRLNCTGLKVPTDGYALVMTQGRHYWQIVAVGPHEESMQVSLRIASSVKLDSPPQDTWQRRDFSGISLELPPSVVVNEEEEKLKPGSTLTRSVHCVTSYEKIVISMVHLASGKEDLDLDAAANHAVTSVSKLPKAASKVTPLTRDGLAARTVKTYYEEDGFEMIRHTFLVTQGHDLWRVVVVGRGNETYKISERIVQSVRMKSGAATGTSRLPTPGTRFEKSDEGSPAPGTLKS